MPLLSQPKEESANFSKALQNLPNLHEFQKLQTSAKPWENIQIRFHLRPAAKTAKLCKVLQFL